MRKLLLTCVVFAFASTSAFAASFKIGVVDMRELLQTSPQVAKINADLRKKFQPRQQKIMTAQNVLKSDMNQYKKNAAVMKSADKTALEQKISGEQTALQQQTFKYQQDLQKEQNQRFAILLKSVQGVINSIAKKQGMDLVLAKAGVPYANSKLDITSTVKSALK